MAKNTEKLPEITFPLKYTVVNSLHDKDEIYGEKVILNEKGEFSDESLKSFTAIVQRYSDKTHESSRFIFINKAGEIVRHEVFGSVSVVAAELSENSAQLYEMRDFAVNNDLQIVFLHNHPGGEVHPSPADVEVTKSLEDFLQTSLDDKSRLAGHIILDHGVFGVYSAKDKNWIVWKNDSFITLDDYRRTVSAEVEISGTGELETSNDYKRLVELAKKIDGGNKWNDIDFIPTVFVSSAGKVVGIEFIHSLEYNRPEILADKVKEAARRRGAANAVMIAADEDNYDKACIFSERKGLIKTVCHEVSDGHIKKYVNSKASIFSGHDSKVEVVREKTLYEVFNENQNLNDIDFRISSFFDFEANPGLKNNYQKFISHPEAEKDGKIPSEDMIIKRAVANTLLTVIGWPTFSQEGFERIHELNIQEQARWTEMNMACMDLAGKLCSENGFPQMRNGDKTVTVKNFDDFFTYLSSNPIRSIEAVGGWFDVPLVGTDFGIKNVSKKKTVDLKNDSSSLTSELCNTMYHTSPWSVDFPGVFSSTLYKDIKENDYLEELRVKAKGGDRDAAETFVIETVDFEMLRNLKKKFPDAVVAPVIAEEESGHNQLPYAYAALLKNIGFEVELNIVQAVRAHHTGANTIKRLTNRVRFKGAVQKDKPYILIDDHVDFGGTLRDLKDYIESNGGKVAAFSTLTALNKNTKIQITEDNLNKLNEYGEGVDELLKEYGITDNKSGLTNAEAESLIKLFSDRNRTIESGNSDQERFRLSCQKIGSDYREKIKRDERIRPVLNRFLKLSASFPLDELNNLNDKISQICDEIKNENPQVIRLIQSFNKPEYSKKSPEYSYDTLHNDFINSLIPELITASSNNERKSLFSRQDNNNISTGVYMSNSQLLFNFNKEIVRNNNLSKKQKEYQTQLWNDVKFKNDVGEYSEYSNICNFFDFSNHEDERIEFLECAKEIGSALLSEPDGNQRCVEQFLCKKLGLPTRYENGEIRHWKDEAEKEKYKDAVSFVNLIASEIVDSGIIIGRDKNGNPTVENQFGKTALEGSGIKNVFDLNDFFCKTEIITDTLSNNTSLQSENNNKENIIQNRIDFLNGKIELTDDDLSILVEFKHEYADINSLKKYTNKKFRELSDNEKKELINHLLNDEEYIKYKNCYIAKSKLLYDSSETISKEVSALSKLNDLGYEIYLLPYSYARDNMNCFQKSADSIMSGDFLELKSVISVGEAAGESAYRDARNQANNIYLSIVNDNSEEKIINNVCRSIGAIKKENKKKGIENNFNGILFINFEKTGNTVLYQIEKDGFVRKVEGADYEMFKKIKGTEINSSQVVVDPMTKHGNLPRINVTDNTNDVNNNFEQKDDRKSEIEEEITTDDKSKTENTLNEEPLSKDNPDGSDWSEEMEEEVNASNVKTKDDKTEPEQTDERENLVSEQGKDKNEVSSVEDPLEFLKIASSCMKVEQYADFYNKNYKFKKARIISSKPESSNRCAAYDDEGGRISIEVDDTPEKRKMLAERLIEQGYEFHIPTPEQVSKSGLDEIKNCGQKLCNLLQKENLPEFEVTALEEEGLHKKGIWHFNRHRIEQIESGPLRTRALAILDKLETGDVSDFLENPARKGIVMPPFGFAKENPDGTVEMVTMEGYSVSEVYPGDKVILKKDKESFTMEWTAFQDRASALRGLFEDLEKNNSRIGHLEKIYSYQDSVGDGKDELRANMASQFFHNFSVIARGKWHQMKGIKNKDGVIDNWIENEFAERGAFNENDAIEIAKFLYKKLDHDEKKKMKLMEKQYFEKTGKPFDELIKERFNSIRRPELKTIEDFKTAAISDDSVIFRGSNDNDIESGRISNNLELKIGDRVSIAILAKNFANNKLRQLPMTTLEIKYASKDSNTVVLFDAAKNARYNMPLDEFIICQQKRLEHQKNINALRTKGASQRKVMKEIKNMKKDLHKHGLRIESR